MSVSTAGTEAFARELREAVGRDAIVTAPERLEASAAHR